MSKGGSTTTSVEVPEYIEEAAKRNLTKADRISQLGYVPYYGPDVAAFTPLQEAAMTNVGGQAGAFGLATPAGGAMAGMPAAQEFAGGVRGYSSAPMFEQAQAELAARRPAQKSYIDSFFIDPFTGEYGSNAAAPIDYTTAFPQAPVAPIAPIAPVSPVTPVDTGVGGITDVQDVIDAYDTLPPEVLPPVVPAVGGATPVVGDIVDNTALQGAQNQVIVDAFDQYGDVLSDPNLTPVQVAAANPAFNPEIAIANQDVPVTINTPTGSYTKPASELTSQDFAAATGATYTPATEAGGLGTFTGGGTGTLPAAPTIQPQPTLEPVAATTAGGIEYTYEPLASDFTVASSSPLSQTGSSSPFVPTVPLDTSLPAVQDVMEQYNLTGKSAAAAGVRNIGGAYAQSPAGSGDLVETRYIPRTGQSEIIGVTPTEDYSFTSDLTRSLTDPSYNPEGTVISRALDALFGGITSATPSAGPPPPVYDPTANESAASIARQEAKRAADLKQMVADPAAILAKYDKADRVDVQRKIDEVQTLSATPRPPTPKGKYEARDWIKQNMGVNVDKNDAISYLKNLQTDWDRLNK